MRTINYGDVYTLKSPLEGLDDASLKSLAYMMGSVSNRPVVVIRPPAKWDRFSMVTVISSLSKMGPAYHTDCEDIYGNDREGCNFNWYCQHPFTIPVSRLYRKIGTLDVGELKNLLYTVHWLHDPFMQMDPSNPIPIGYENETLKQYVVTHNDTNKQQNLIQLDRNYRIVKSSDHSLEGKSIIPAQNASNEAFSNQISRIHYMSAAANDSPIVQEETVGVSEEAQAEVAKLKGYGVTYAEEVVVNVRSGKMMLADYNVELAQQREFRYRFAFGDTDIEKELKDYSDDVLNRIWGMYNSCSTTDIFAIIPEMPTREISKIYHVVLRIASAFKKLCTLARDLSQNAYEERREQYKKENGIEDVKETGGTRGVTEGGTPSYTTTSIPEYKTDLITDPGEIQSSLLQLEHYLDYDHISKINDVPTMRLFLSIPVYAIKDAYHGNSFMKAYSSAVKKYKTILANVR